MKHRSLTPTALAALMALNLGPAWAQSAEPERATDGKLLPKVVVTGSNIKRTDTETSQPLQVISREDIKTTGALTVGEVLGTLTTNDGNAISDLGGANSWASGASGVSLRNLGTGGTLVLVNGRRVSSYGFADGLQLNFTNIDSIPANIIERVEVLKDGASAIYGSDAIGGVINIITRQDFAGLELSASTQQSLRRSWLAKEQQASLTAGRGSLDANGYNVYGHLEFFKRGSYKDRAVRPLLPDWFVQMNPDRDQLSTGSMPGNYVGRYPANYADPALAGKSINRAAPGCAPELLIGGLCRYDYWKDSDAMPGTDRVTALAGARVKLGQEWTGFVEFHGADIRAKYYTAVPRSNITGVPLNWYDSIKGELQYFTDPQLPVGHPANPYSFPIGLNYRFSDNPEMFKNVGSSTQYRLLAGAEGHWAGWDIDTAVGVMGSKARQRQHGARDRYGYHDAIVNGEYKFGQANPQELLDRMFPEYGSSGRYKQLFVDLKGSREIARIGNRPVMLATGVELRHEDFWHRSSDNVLAARIVQFSGVSISGKRDMAAMFAEVEAPLTRELKATLALRGDKVFDGAGAVTPKVQLAWRPNERVMLRGTATQGFRAPSLPETGNGGASWFNNGYVDPKRCATATQMRDILKTGNAADQVNANVAYALGCSVSFPAAVSPNPDLKPEHSNNVSVGIVLQPLDALSLSLDYYSIRRRDEIGVRSVDATLANEDLIPGLVDRGALTVQDKELAQRIKELTGRDLGFAVGPVRSISAQYRNQNKTKVSGLDLDVRARWGLGDWGRLSTGLELNYQLEYRDWDSYANTYSENYVGGRGTPRTRAVGKLNWNRGDWSLGSRINYRAGQKLAWGTLDSSNTLEGCADRGVEASACRIASNTTVDLWLQYSGLKNLVLSANLFNVFDRADPVQMRAGSYLPLAGRVAKLSAEYHF